MDKHGFGDREHVPVEEPQTATQQGYSWKYSLGKRISEFGERLAVSPLEQLDNAIVEGLNHIVALVDADRICWYELEGNSGALHHKYTGCVRQAPL